jgi:hypothetical protein
VRISSWWSSATGNSITGMSLVYTAHQSKREQEICRTGFETNLLFQISPPALLIINFHSSSHSIIQSSKLKRWYSFLVFPSIVKVISITDLDVYGTQATHFSVIQHLTLSATRILFYKTTRANHESTTALVHA